jgi:hypothetical protein
MRVNRNVHLFLCPRNAALLLHVEKFTRVKLLLPAAAPEHVENFTRVKTQQRCSTGEILLELVYYSSKQIKWLHSKKIFVL